MKICIDTTPIGIQTSDKGGIYRYIFDLIKALSQIDNKNSYTLFFNFFRKRHLPAFNDAVKNIQAGNNFHIKLSRFPPRLRLAMNLPVDILSGDFDVFHGCFDYLPSILSGNGVVTIHDVRYLEDMDFEVDPSYVDILKKSTPSPEYFIQDYLAMGKLFENLRSSIKTTIQRAGVIITISEFCKARLLEKLHLQPEKIKVIYHGVNKQFHPQSDERIKHVLSKYGINRPYILYTGKFDPLKNIANLIEAFKIIAASRDITLVMAGPVNWYYYIILEKVKQFDLTDRIVFTNFVADDEIASLYSGASVFVLPSLYEGFGMPLLEAMACEIPVVTSNSCSISEVAGNAAFFVDPYSPDNIAYGISQCLSNADLRADLIIKGKKQAGFFSWKTTAANTLQVYKNICR